MKRDSNKETAIQANISKDKLETCHLSQADTKVQINQLEFRIVNQRSHLKEKQKTLRETLHSSINTPDHSWLDCTIYTMFLGKGDIPVPTVDAKEESAFRLKMEELNVGVGMDMDRLVIKHLKIPIPQLMF